MTGHIARVFPRKTNMSPTDELAFFGAPTMWDMLICQKHNVEAVHISVTFTYDLEKAEDLYYAWQALGVPVEVGGPAFDDRMGDFTPGMYLKEGCIFTSRGCTKDCWFCSVPRCAHGVIRELPIVDGWNIMDDNILGTSEKHFREVMAMLKRQKEKAVFSGGLEPQLLQQWQADMIKEIKPQALYTAYDTKDDYEPLIEMGKKFRQAGFSDHSHALRCYVLIGYPDDTMDEAKKRIIQTMDAGFMPFSMLYRDDTGEVDPEWKKFNRNYCNPYCVGKLYGMHRAGIEI